ncbi:hypothetical protein MNV84_02041 [Leishmania braziliensis]|nr:hypothetical protein MNV84_02041 [Leishmania braziliensis]
MSFASSHTSPSTTASPEVLLTAYKAEAQQLRDDPHKVTPSDMEGCHSSTRGDTGAAARGVFGEALEGKYLLLIRKNKDLTVQLGTVQQQLAAAQKALQAEQEKTQRLVSAVTVSSLGTRGVKSSSKLPAGATGLDDGGSSNSGNKTNGGSGGGIAAASSTAIARVYDQLHQKELAMAEVQRENATLRSLIQREVGLRDDTREVDDLLRRAAAASSSGGSTPAGVGCKSSSGTDAGGWRGRAEEIVLLKCKLKDVQRELKMVVAQSGSGRGEDGVDTLMDPLALPASVRAFLGVDADPATEARSIATTTTSQVRRPRRDVDSYARDRLSAMQHQRAAQQRELSANLEQQQHELNEERMKSSALQARVKTMKSELHTLRSYVDTILEKSSTDDELVAAYKTELQRANEEIRHWRRAAEETLKGASRGCNSDGETSTAFTVKGMRSGLDNAAAAAARAASYRQATEDKTIVSAGCGEEGKACAAPLPLWSSQSPKSFSRSLYEWVCQACDEVPQEVEPKSTQPAVEASAKQLAAVLRHAYQHVVLVERSTVAAADMALAVPTSTSGESILHRENTALKRRVCALSDLMEKELQAQRVLWTIANADATPSTTS